MAKKKKRYTIEYQLDDGLNRICSIESLSHLSEQEVKNIVAKSVSGGTKDKYGNTIFLGYYSPDSVYLVNFKSE